MNSSDGFISDDGDSFLARDPFPPERFKIFDVRQVSDLLLGVVPGDELVHGFSEPDIGGINVSAVGGVSVPHVFRSPVSNSDVVSPEDSHVEIKLGSRGLLEFDSKGFLYGES